MSNSSQHQRRVIGHVSGTIEYLNTCICGNPWPCPIKLYYVHYNGAAWFVKDAEFFKDQGGLTEEWGKGWQPIEAESIENAREKAASLQK